MIGSLSDKNKNNNNNRSEVIMIIFLLLLLLFSLLLFLLAKLFIVLENRFLHEYSGTKIRIITITIITKIILIKNEMKHK